MKHVTLYRMPNDCVFASFLPFDGMAETFAEQFGCPLPQIATFACEPLFEEIANLTDSRQPIPVDVVLRRTEEFVLLSLGQGINGYFTEHRIGVLLPLAKWKEWRRSWQALPQVARSSISRRTVQLKRLAGNWKDDGSMPTDELQAQILTIVAEGWNIIERMSQPVAV